MPVHLPVTDTSAPDRGSVGRLIASVLFGIAEIEREHLRERQAAGITVAKQNGIYKGRKQGSTKAMPKRTSELRRQGLNKTEIARALGVSPQTVWRYLKQEPKQPKVGPQALSSSCHAWDDDDNACTP